EMVMQFKPNVRRQHRVERLRGCIDADIRRNLRCEHQRLDRLAKHTLVCQVFDPRHACQLPFVIEGPKAGHLNQLPYSPAALVRWRSTAGITSEANRRRLASASACEIVSPAFNANTTWSTPIDSQFLRVSMMERGSPTTRPEGNAGAPRNPISRAVTC